MLVTVPSLALDTMKKKNNIVNDLSAVAVDTGDLVNNCKRILIFGKII